MSEYTKEEIEAAHCWGEFLLARARAIQAFHARGDTDETIARTLSIDETQVRLMAIASTFSPLTETKAWREIYPEGPTDKPAQ